MIKNINKFISIVLILFFIAMPFVYAEDTDPAIGETWEEEKARLIAQGIPESELSQYDLTPSDVKITDGFGVYIKLVKYDQNTKEETIIGTPILLYSGGLLDDIREIGTSNAGSFKVDGGKTVTACMGTISNCEKKYPPEQYPDVVVIAPGDPNYTGAYNPDAMEERFEEQLVSEVTCEGGTCSGEIDLAKENGEYVAADNCTRTATVTYSGGTYYYYKKKDIKFLLDDYKSVSTKKNYQIEKLPSLGANTIKATTDFSTQADLYSYIKNFSGSVTVIRSAVDLGTQENLYNYINSNILGVGGKNSNKDSRIFRSNNGSGDVTLNNVLTAFKIDHINMNEVKNYYFSFEPVTREKTDVSVKSWLTISGPKATNPKPEPGFKWKCTHKTNGKNPITIIGTRSQPSAKCYDYHTEYKTIPGSCSQCCVGPTDSNGDCISGKTKECGCSTVPYSVEDKYAWDFLQCDPTGYIYVITTITTHIEKVSVIQPARYGGENTESVNKRISKLSNIIYQTENSHEIVKEIHHEDGTSENKPTGEYEYYIGPTADTAMVVEDKLFNARNNKYHLVTASTPRTAQGANVDGEPKTTAGVGYWWLLAVTNCKKECTGTGDELLKCAENYCDNATGYDTRANVRKQKAGCIIDLCGYVYGQDPSGNGEVENNQSVTSCANANPYKNVAITDNKNSSSSCSIDSTTGENYTKGVTTTCIGDVITDFDGDDTNENPARFDGRTYINIACKETSLFTYTDTSRKVYVAGEGIDYYAKLKGERECTVFFDLEQWKFDYATIHSQDTLRRKRLEFIYSVFNNQLNDGYDITKNPLYDTEFEENEGEIDWDKLLFNDTYVSVSARVKEIVMNKEMISEKEDLVKVKGDIETSQNISLNEKITTMKNLNVGKFDVNRYIQTSNIENYYGFSKRCVSTDGKATVYASPENGICYVKKGNYCSPENGLETTNVYGENRYYINKYADSASNHLVSTFATVKKVEANGEATDTNYYDNSEVCNYTVNDKKGASCTITITPDAETTALGNDIYEGGKVSATVRYYEELGSDDGIASSAINVSCSPNGVTPSPTPEPTPEPEPEPTPEPTPTPTTNEGPTCQVNITNNNSTGGITTTVICSDSDDGCDTSRNPKGDTNLKSSTEYTVYDKAGNKGTCGVKITTQKQKDTKTCCPAGKWKTNQKNCDRCGSTISSTKTTTVPYGTCNESDSTHKCNVTKTIDAYWQKCTCVYYKCKTCDYCSAKKEWCNNWTNDSSCSTNSTTKCRTIYKGTVYSNPATSNVSSTSNLSLSGSNLLSNGNYNASSLVLNNNLLLNNSYSVSRLASTDGSTEAGVSINGNTAIIGIADANSARRDCVVEGTVTTKKGETVTCSKTVILHQYTSCGLSCGVDKVNDTLYEIKGVGSISEYSTSLSTNMTRRRLQPSVTDNKYYVRISEPLDSTSKEDPTIIFGYVKNNRCENYCRTPKPDLSNCLDEYDPANTGCIKSYCESNYDKDINNYESVEECIQMCSRDRMCPEDRRDLETVRTFCNNQYSGLGYSSSDACINICYYQPDSDANYLYRTINVRNPFPNSADSEAPYKTGPRLIGSNWYGLSHYIKDDKDDSTSITGSSANSSVEYIIDLTQEDIRRIRDDTNKIKSNQTYDAYTDYIYSADYRESEYVGRYKSKFIHDDFGYLFKKLPD